jgi:hypothetical protein
MNIKTHSDVKALLEDLNSRKKLFNKKKNVSVAKALAKANDPRMLTREDLSRESCSGRGL